MANLTLTTFDWVPEMPRGFVRDLRVRWALEEAALALSRRERAVRRPRDAAHFAHQPFGQVPWLTDGDLSIFESGAILLHLGELSDGADAHRSARPQRGDGMAVRRAQFGGDGEPALDDVQVHPAVPTTRRPWKFVDDFLKLRLKHMEPVLAEREWLAGTFSVADILMADVLRLVDRFDGLAEHPACRAYVARATARPAFVKAHADQMAHFAAADAKRRAD